MITSASHCDRSAFLTSSRAWFWCSNEQKKCKCELQDRAQNVAKMWGKVKWCWKAVRAKKKTRSLHHCRLWTGIREIRQKRDSISSYRTRHITLAHSSDYSAAPRQLSQPSNICDKERESVCSCVGKCAGGEVSYLFSLVLLAASLRWSLHWGSLWAHPASFKVYSPASRDSPV